MKAVLFLFVTVLTVEFVFAQNFTDRFDSRTFFYDDHQVFFTMMVYFPFMVDVWSYSASSLRTAPHEESYGKTEEIFFRNGEVVEDDFTNEKSNRVLDFDKRSIPDGEKIHSRKKRTFYIDDQEVDLFLCLSLPFSVPLLRYDQDLMQAAKNKKARKQFESNLPLVPLHDDEFESQYNEDDIHDEDENVEDVFVAEEPEQLGFGKRSTEFGARRRTSTKNRHHSRRHRADYTETEFTSVKRLFSGGSRERTQLWSPVNNFDNYDYVKARMTHDRTQSTSEVISSATLVSVDERVIDLIESFPRNCSQRVLCRLSKLLTESSPIQAILLFNYESNVFGYRDIESRQAIDVALAGNDCEKLFEPCPGNMA